MSKLADQISTPEEDARPMDRAAFDPSRVEFLHVFDHAPVGMALIDLQGVRYRVNQSLADFLGYTVEELTATTMESTNADPQRLAKSIAMRQRVIDGEIESYTNERAYIRKDGETVWGVVTGSLVRDGDGAPMFFIAHTVDITERKRAEAELLDSEERFRETSEISSDWLWETDAELRFSYLSPSFDVISGMHSSQVLGKTREEFGSGTPDDPRWRRHLEDLKARRPFRDFHYQSPRSDGMPQIVSVSGKPRFDPNGQFIGYRGTCRDITQLVETQMALERARDDAEAANRAKSEFLSSMSHELRTPLNAILGFSQVLEAETNELQGEHQRDYLGHIISAGGHLLELIDQVLELSSIDSDGVRITTADIDPRAVLDDSLAMARTIAKETDVTVNDDTGDGVLPLVHVDPTRLKQVLLNLLSNALKYNRPGGSVDVRCRVVDDQRLRITIADTGEGIPEAMRHAIFEPFNRVGKQLTNIKGSGIGLTICKRLVEQMGGRINFDSTLGEGSRFWIEVPLGGSTEVAGASEDAAPDTLAASEGHWTVLYIEDNAMNAHLMRTVLGALPAVRMLSAEDAETGLRLAQASPPDLILMDIHLPGIDGINAMKILRADPRTERIPVVAVSAAAMQADIDGSMEAGFDAFLTKPINIRETLRVIGDALNKD